MIYGNIPFFRIKWSYLLGYGLLFGGLSGFISWLEFNYTLEAIDPRWAFFWIGLLFTIVGAWGGRVLTSQVTSTASMVKIHEVSNDGTDLRISMDHATKPVNGLSDREYEVLVAMAAGKSNQEIANDLYIAISTVKTHVSRILQKTDAKRRTQAIRHAKRMGWIR
ncbi:MAG: response regulator transcription factor [Saprospiraceae bacterium]|nr:response regulator transcription factor [Saprospiraceae bacterium]MCB9318510.1 response regulator transcription factor [Lewinellaceae bacterium]